MKGRVVFWFILDEQKSAGMVLFRLFGQRCQSCSPKLFEHAMWYPEEVIKVNHFLYRQSSLASALLSQHHWNNPKTLVSEPKIMPPPNSAWFGFIIKQ